MKTLKGTNVDILAYYKSTYEFSNCRICQKNLFNNSLKISLHWRGVEWFLNAYLGKWQVYWIFSRVEQLLFRGKKETYIWIHRICMGGCLRSSDVTKSRQEVDLGLRKSQFQTKWEYIKKNVRVWQISVQVWRINIPTYTLF